MDARPAILLLLSLPTAALAAPLPSLFSAQGLPEDGARVGVEVGLLSLESERSLELPMVGVRYGHNVIDRLDARLSLATLGVYTDAEAGISVAVVREASWGLGVRAAISGLALADDGLDVMVAGTPGVVATVGSEEVALTLAFDTPVAFGGIALDNARQDDHAGVELTLRPSATLEVGAGDAVFYVRGSALLMDVGNWRTVVVMSSGVHF